MSDQFKVNDFITTPELFVIDETGKPIGLIGRDQALYLAYDRGLDLVEVGPNARPPVAKIIDHGKFTYQQHKKQQKQKSGSKVSEVKQIRLSATIEPHDLATKANRGKEFLANGHKVRVSIVLKGRQRAHANLAFEVIDQFLGISGGRFDFPPKMIGNMVNAVIAKN